MEENTCPVCHEIPSFFAIGRCDHPICFKCSTRMRVLCEQMYCAICRSDLPEVLFVRQPAKFSDIVRKNFIPLRRHRILFQDFDAEEAFKTLQEIRCRICKDRAPDRTFKALKDHMRRDHTLFYCDLCLEHTKLFAFERKFYNRKDLATHRRTGDADDTSYKGHPLCKFCDERYMDNDELLRHLRKDHYFCHFCDGDGSNEYYNDYDELNKHFEHSHYVCKLDDCIHKKFTNAFRSNIDLKAHIANEHNQNMTKQQAKEARTLDVNFQFAPRVKGRARGVAGVSREDYEDAPAGPRGSGRGSYRYRQEMIRDRELREQIERAREASMKEALRATEKEMREVERKRREAEEQEAARLEAERIQNEIKSIERDFPSLSGAAAAPPSIVPHSVSRTHPVIKIQNSGKPQSAGKGQTGGKTNKKQTQDNSTQQFKRSGPGRLDSTEYPSLGGTPVPPPSVSEGRSSPNIQVVPESILRSLKKEEPVTVVSTRVPKRTSEDFPTLGGARNPKSDSNVSLMSLGVWSGKSKKNEIRMDSATRNEKPQANINSASLASLGNSLCQTGYQTKNNTNTRVASPKLTEKNNNSGSKTVTKPKTQSESTVKVAPPKTRDKQPPVESSQPSEESQSKKNKKKKKQKEQKEVSEDRPESAASGKDTKSKKSKSTDPVSKMFTDQNDRDSGIESSSGSVDSASLPNYQVEQLSKISETSTQPVAETSSVAASTFSPLQPDSTSGSLDTIAVGLLSIGASSAVSNGFPTLDDFPSLNSPSTLAPPPPGFNSSPAPPGFGGLSSGSRPPPGFSSESTLKAPLSAELDNFVFSKPAHFSERNKALVQTVSDLLKNDQDQFGKFKAYSGSFRQGSLDAVSYYHNCQDLLGQEDFSKIIPELIALLPDIDKQQELLSVHKDVLKAGPGGRSGVVKISGKTSKAPWSVAAEFKTCPTCRQVLVQRDYDGHLNEHSGISDFPTLGGSGHNPKFMGQGSWIKAK